MELSSVVLCGPGKIRSENQDNYYLNGVYQKDPSLKKIQCFQNRAPAPALYAVADGMGGERYGEQAALIAVSAMDGAERTARGLEDYLLERNDRVCQMIQAHGGVRSGAAFVGLCVMEGAACVVNLGDCRAYLFREGRLSQLSQDHTAVRPMVELGVLTPQAARRHPDRHKLTQHLGVFPEELLIEPHTVQGSVQPGDLFLLCSDGLHDLLEENAITRLLGQADSPRRAACLLFRAAMEAGGRDNLTVLLVEVEEKEMVP